MSGKVFISCGQRPPRERNIAIKVGEMLKKEFNLDYYLAFKIQGLDDIMKITEELKSSDYYLFIDFIRRDKNDLPCSLFTHQELALAYHLQFKEMIAFQEEGAPLEGFLKYVLSNPEPFSNETELLEKVMQLVKERGWSKDYSRNLIIDSIEIVGPILYQDQTGKQFEYVWQARIENHRLDLAALNSICMLDYVVYPNGEQKECYDRSFLKWAGQLMDYQRTILPKEYGKVDIFSIHIGEVGIYLHSARDFVPRDPILKDEGKYILCYKLFSANFPLLSFSIDVNYKHSIPSKTEWQNRTEAKLRK